MTPRELLIESLWLRSENSPDHEDISDELKPYAIGRWVPVSERLPAGSKNGKHWKGFIETSDGLFYMWCGWVGDLKSPHICGHEIVRWLELDMPKGDV